MSFVFSAAVAAAADPDSIPPSGGVRRKERERERVLVVQLIVMPSKLTRRKMICIPADGGAAAVRGATNRLT